MHPRIPVCLLFLGTALASPAGAVINVPADHGTIQAAINAAPAGETILVAPGTYVENVTINKNIALLSSGGRATTTIEGISSAGSLGAVVFTSNTTSAQLGDTGQGFTILGIDNGNPAIENAAVYFQGPHSNTIIRDNEIRAIGDLGLVTEYGLAVTGLVIQNNEFSGSTFFNPPADYGFANQFTTPNVPRQLVAMGCGGGCVTTSGIVFQNNVISGTTGGINPSSQEQGNTMVTIDASGSTIAGNQFIGTTTRFATSLRSRGPSTTISGNTFSSAGLTPTVGHVFVDNTGQTTGAIATANTFDKSVWVDAVTGTIGWKVQLAHDVVPAGTLLRVGPGTYEEQVHITKNITLQGAGAASTTILSPVTLPLNFNTGVLNHPVIFVDGTSNAIVRDLEVDGAGRGNANYRFIGIAFWNAGGAALNCDVIGIRDTPFSGTQHGVGIYSFNNTGGPYALEVGWCNVSTFQKNAMALSGNGMVVDVHDCVTTGSGDTAVTAQNGIQVSFGAGGSVDDCTISNVRYTPASAAASGLLVYQAGSAVTVGGVNVISNAQAPVSWYDSNGSMSGLQIAGGDFDAVYVFNTTASAGPGGTHADRAPLMDSYVPEGSQALTFAVSLAGGCFTGTGSPSTAGLYVDSNGGPITVTAANLRITNYGYGVVADGAAATVNISNSSIAGNVVAGFDNTLSLASQNAENNWWGMLDGPGGVGGGSGDAILGTGVAFNPWLLSSVSSTPCAFTPTATNEVVPEDPLTCISTDSTCVNVDVNVVRSENTEMRGFSVKFQLTNLQLCTTPFGSIHQGTYLSSMGATIYQVLDNGGGLYTVDCAIQGAMNCGQDDPTGELFNIDVEKVSDGIGTIAITSVTFRDCLNAPIAGAPGAALNLVVDTAGPSPIANLNATQVKTGNDSDGTTKITVTFTAPGDADLIEVYRAPYGVGTGVSAYPEYDDVGGASAPAAPTYPPAAPWTLTGVTASGGADEPATRGYWYYTVFTKDECGNVSTVSNATTGVLNYHLGDVADGFTPGQGDNLVSGPDISDLGNNYGASLVFNDPVNYLDVGPTDDFSVDGLPTTDNLVNFEDLILFAINFGEVSLTDPRNDAISLEQGRRPSLKLDTAARALDGTLTARLVLNQPVDVVQGVHARLAFDPQLVRVLSVEPGDLARSGGIMFDTIERDGGIEIDAAALGHGATLHGSGAYAIIRFETSRNALPTLAEFSLRDTRNRDILAPAPVVADPAGAQLDPAHSEVASAGFTTHLIGARPNPFQDETRIRFQLASGADVKLDIFDVKGRLVQSVTPGHLGVGEHEVVWDGRTASGWAAETGVYLYRLQAGDRTWSEKLFHRR